MLDLLRPAEPGERFHPHTIPLYLVDRLVKAYGLEVFIETGTYTGATVENVLGGFKEIYTIELDPKLAANARWRFEDPNLHVHVLEGNSAGVLYALLAGKIPGASSFLKDKRALLWLDAHWSGGITAREDVDVHTAVRAELAALRDLSQRDHVLMIDDIDDFSGEHGYPMRGELIDLVQQINLDYDVRILPVRRGVLVALPPI